MQVTIELNKELISAIDTKKKMYVQQVADKRAESLSKLNASIARLKELETDCINLIDTYVYIGKKGIRRPPLSNHSCLPSWPYYSSSFQLRFSNQNISNLKGTITIDCKSDAYQHLFYAKDIGFMFLIMHDHDEYGNIQMISIDYDFSTLTDYGINMCNAFVYWFLDRFASFKENFMKYITE